MAPAGRAAAAASLVAAGLALGCTAARDAEMMGPCNVQYAEPLIVVAGATDANTGRSVPEVTLRSYTHNGRPDLGPTFLTDHYGLAPYNVRADGNALICTVACGFGASAGTYVLTFGANGYRDTTFALDAQFARGTGNCPRTLSGGVTLRLALRPP